jgi:predicted transcriptional regulator
MKRKPLEIKKKIIEILKKEGEVSIKKLEKKVNTNYQTIINNCEELEYLGIIKTRKTYDDSVNGKSYRVAELITKYN